MANQSQQSGSFAKDHEKADEVGRKGGDILRAVVNACEVGTAGLPPR